MKLVLKSRGEHPQTPYHGWIGVARNRSAVNQTKLKQHSKVTLGGMAYVRGVAAQSLKSQYPKRKKKKNALVKKHYTRKERHTL